MRNSFNHFFAGFFIMTFFACASTRASQEKVNFTGHIFEHRLNSMPMVDKPRSKGSPLKTMIYVYEPTLIRQMEDQMIPGPTVSKINSKLIDSAYTDNLGAYKMYLKPGKYSVFVRYESGYYVPYLSGSDWASIIEIKTGVPTVLDIDVRANSSYE
jgi:hypothetical protein